MISFIGMRTQEVKAQQVLNVVLKPESEMIDEVMVVAYGTAKKSSFTGSASTMRGDKIQKMQVSNISRSLEGTVAGVQVAASSGSPGTAANIRIRGIGSVSSSQEPLIVVDGVPYEGSLNSISAQDIESMTVLKDAAANSMYGARGSNGVIIITTKGSKSGKAKINFEARYGFNKRGVGNYDIVTDAGQYYEMMYESYKNALTGENGDAAASLAATNLIPKLLKYNKFKGVADDALIDPATGKLNPAATT
ncbi:MAG: TonB-dependent receptor plug domain-containing protein [Phocaeicola plebeius]|nr:TonB-dependent receptor plug domain-containing protein [Phocaeicola plebeius]